MYWHKIRANGEKPGERLCHTLTPLPGNRILLFGGWTNVNGAEVRFNDLSILDVESETWTITKATGDIPAPRSTHSLTPINQGKQLLLFAGYIGGEQRCNDIHILDLGTLTWQAVHVPSTEPRPQPRNTHTAVLLDDGHRLAVFGGRDEHYFFNDSWILDLRKMRWHRVETTGPVPRARSGHSAVVVRGHAMLVFGGWGGGYPRFNDLHELNLNTGAWTNYEPGLMPTPRPRSGHAACLICPTLMLVFGGWGQGHYLNDVWLLNTDTMLWRMAGTHGAQPGERRFHGLAVLDNRVYLHGGRNTIVNFKDTQVLIIGPRPLRDLCIGAVIADHDTHAGRIAATLPRDLQQRIVAAHARAMKRKARDDVQEEGEDGKDDEDEDDELTESDSDVEEEEEDDDPEEEDANQDAMQQT